MYILICPLVLNGEAERSAHQQIISSISTLSQYPGTERPEGENTSDPELVLDQIKRSKDKGGFGGLFCFSGV